MSEAKKAREELKALKLLNAAIAKEEASNKK